MSGNCGDDYSSESSVADVSRAPEKSEAGDPCVLEGQDAVRKSSTSRGSVGLESLKTLEVSGPSRSFRSLFLSLPTEIQVDIYSYLFPPVSFRNPAYNFSPEPAHGGSSESNTIRAIVNASGLPESQGISHPSPDTTNCLPLFSDPVLRPAAQSVFYGTGTTAIDVRGLAAFVASGSCQWVRRLKIVVPAWDLAAGRDYTKEPLSLDPARELAKQMQAFRTGDWPRLTHVDFLVCFWYSGRKSAGFPQYFVRQEQCMDMMRTWIEQVRKRGWKADGISATIKEDLLWFELQAKWAILAPCIADQMRWGRLRYCNMRLISQKTDSRENVLGGILTDPMRDERDELEGPWPASEKIEIFTPFAPNWTHTSDLWGWMDCALGKRDTYLRYNWFHRHEAYPWGTFLHYFKEAVASVDNERAEGVERLVDSENVPDPGRSWPQFPDRAVHLPNQSVVPPYPF